MPLLAFEKMEKAGYHLVGVDVGNYLKFSACELHWRQYYGGFCASHVWVFLNYFVDYLVYVFKGWCLNNQNCIVSAKYCVCYDNFFGFVR